MPIVVKSTRGNPKLIHQNYVYQLDKFSADGTRKHWKCEQRSICHGRLHTDSETGEVVAEPAGQTHAPEKAHVEVLLAMESMKDRAVNTQDTTRQVIQSACQVN